MRKWLSSGVLLAVLAVGATSAIQALPSGGSGFDLHYFADDTFTGDLVGERYMECDSSPIGWGVVTHYVDDFTWDCQSGSTGYTQCTRKICYWTEDANGNRTGQYCWDAGECYDDL